jgi:predicted transcriptional regulator of viral defense system
MPYFRPRRPRSESRLPASVTKITVSRAIIQGLASEGRRVLSDWRAMVLLRRATQSLPPGERRWSYAPDSVQDTWPLLRKMVQRGELKPVKGLDHVYQVTAPFADQGLIDETEILIEVHPYSALSHQSALLFHGITLDLSKQITATVPESRPDALLPPGTRPDDWEGISLVRGAYPDSILGNPVRWIKTVPSRYFGTKEYRPRGYPLRVTDLERTLLDGLLRPELTGGIGNVLRAWALSRDLIDLNLLVAYANRFGVAVLRQRVGLIMDELSLHHPEVDSWPAMAHRGGSSKLVGSEPFSPTYSERWQLSINAPISLLHENGG